MVGKTKIKWRRFCIGDDGFNKSHLDMTTAKKPSSPIILSISLTPTKSHLCLGHRTRHAASEAAPAARPWPRAVTYGIANHEFG